RDAARRTTISLREDLHMLVVGSADLYQAVGQLQRGLQRIGEPAAIFGADDKSIDDDLDAVILPPVELRRIRDFDELAVDVCPNEALLSHRLEQLAKFALPALNEWGSH